MNINFSYLKYKKLLIAVGIFLFAIKGFSQVGLLITYFDGSQYGYSVTASGKLFFVNDNLMIAKDENSTPTSIPVSIIRKITFSDSVLPLNLVDYNITNSQTQVSLFWKTENEFNTSHFIIQRSSDGVNYESIAQVASIKNSNSNSYSFIDKAPKVGLSYYKLKQIDNDGRYTFSKVLTVNRSESASIVIMPNPANNYFSINTTTPQKLHIKVYAALGQLMLEGNYAPTQPIDISKLATGMYMVFINEKPYKLIKQ